MCRMPVGVYYCTYGHGVEGVIRQREAVVAELNVEVERLLERYRNLIYRRL